MLSVMLKAWVTCLSLPRVEVIDSVKSMALVNERVREYRRVNVSIRFNALVNCLNLPRVEVIDSVISRVDVTCLSLVNEDFIPSVKLNTLETNRGSLANFSIASVRSIVAVNNLVNCNSLVNVSVKLIVFVTSLTLMRRDCTDSVKEIAFIDSLGNF